MSPNLCTIIRHQSYGTLAFHCIYVFTFYIYKIYIAARTLFFIFVHYNYSSRTWSKVAVQILNWTLEVYWESEEMVFCLASVIDSVFSFLKVTSREKAMARHSSALAWQIPWTELPGGLQSMGSLGVGHDWATSLSFSLSTFHFHALEKEMATHSNVLAWRIPGMGEPDGLPSMGSHRVRHNWSDLAAAAVTVNVSHSIVSDSLWYHGL